MNKEQKEILDTEVSNAAHGKLVINNPVFQQAFTARKAKIFDVFCNTKAEEEDQRQEAWRTMQNLLALEKYFEKVLTSGKMAEETLKIHEK